jgi:hypothetical protein
MLIPMRTKPVGEGDATAAGRSDDLDRGSRWRAFSTFQAGRESGDIDWIESDRSAEVDDGELTALDQSLHGARVHAEKLHGLLRRQQRLKRVLRLDRLRQRVTRHDRSF